MLKILRVLLPISPVDPNILILPADHVISDVDAFHDAIGIAMCAADRGAIVTFGLKPRHAETGYGYIKVGSPCDVSQVYTVDKFIEKPDVKTARNFLNKGGYLWNSGMFLLKTSTFLDELTRYAPKTRKACKM